MKKTVFKHFIFASSILIMFLVVITSCNDSNPLGAEIIDPDRPDVVFTDTLTLLSTTVREDSVKTYDNLSLLSTYFCGNFNDPVFGNSVAEINTQLRLSGALPDTLFSQINNGEATLDSVVFVLEYDTARFYGDLDVEQDLEIRLLSEDMDNNATYYSNDNFDATELLTTATINPSQYHIDSAFTAVRSGDTIYFPSVRIPLNKNHDLFQNYLFSGEKEYYDSDSALLQVFKGVKLKVNNPTDLMMAFNLSSAQTGMFLYYHTSNDTSRYRFWITNKAAQMVYLKSDDAGSTVEPFISDDNGGAYLGDSLIFIQGMSGLNAKLSIPFAKNLQNIIVNKAELDFTVASMLPEDKSVFYENPISNILISKKDEDGKLIVIADLSAAIS
ncbi:MAG TPA: DUF4270 family protein, partial [Bacteroidetes bacterium]|nr:DUF4270 family protein [Bacteroidota bacterium]